MNYLLPFIPFQRGQGVVAIRQMPVFDCRGRRCNKTEPRKLIGTILQIDNQRNPWLLLRLRDGSKLWVWSEEVQARWG